MRHLWRQLALVGTALGLGSCSRSIVERLENPTPVDSVEATGLRLSDGTFVSFGLEVPVPANLTALDALVAHGIEVDSHGRAIGLVHVHHWCGNDSIKKHLARVDVASVLEFLGGRTRPGSNETLDFTDVDLQFTQYGWRMERWRAFERWRGADPDRVYR